jgi:hypothetical protein
VQSAEIDTRMRLASSRTPPNEGHTVKKIIAVAWFVAVPFSMACSDRHQDHRQLDSSSGLAPPSKAATPRPVALSLAGRYFGIARTEHGDYAEFLKLEAGGTGALYSAQQWTKVCQWKIGDGVVSFQTAEDYGMFHTFAGAVAHDTIRGSLRFIEDTSRVRSQMEVTFQPLDTSDATARILGVPGGLFSNVHYVEEAGDVVGTEIFIGTVRGALKLAVAFVEGAPTIPFVPREFSVSADTLRFQTGASQTDGQKFTAVFSQREVELWPADLKAGPAGLQVERLPKSHSIDDFFQQKAEGKCVGPLPTS